MEIIPINATVHYKVAFDIHTPDQNGITHIRRILRNWCLSSTKNFDNNELHSAWFFRGNNTQCKIGNYLFRTVVNIGDLDLETPRNWAIEIIHQDRDYRYRTWSAEISLSQLDPFVIRFATTVKYWITEGYIGQLPDNPDISTPRYVRDIINENTGQLNCRKGDESLNSNPTIVKIGQGKKLFEKIISDQRYLPLIIISKLPKEDAYCIDTKVLQKNILGNANIYLLEDHRVNKELNYYLGYDLSCSVGSLRIYMPRLILNSRKDSFRHRYYSNKYIEEYLESNVIKDLVIGLSRNARTFTPKEILSISDVITERRRYRISELLSTKLDSEEQTEEIKLLWEEIKDLTKKNTDLDNMAEVYSNRNEELSQENAELKWKASHAEELREETIDLKRKIHVLDNLQKLPKSLCDVIEVILKLYSSKIIFTERGIKSASEYKNSTEVYQEAWSILKYMADVLYDLIFTLESNELEKEFINKTGYELAMTEGKQTKKDGSLMKLRKDTYESKEIDITPHIKYGNREPKMLRIHFAVDRDEKLIIIGHCGGHLDNFTTKSIS